MRNGLPAGDFRVGHVAGPLAGEDDLYAAIDKVEEKLNGELRKRKTKMVDRRRHVEARRKERIRRFGR